MELTDDDVLEILRLIDESSYDYLEIESGDLKLVVSKGGHVSPAPTAAPARSAPPAGPAPEGASEPQAVEAGPPPAVDSAPAAREGLIAVTAPMVGTFYRAPDPESPPFVEQGARVDQGTTVGLIEVMKVFTGVRAGAAGVIAEVIAENARLVERGAVLFYIDPDGGA